MTEQAGEQGHEVGGMSRLSLLFAFGREAGWLIVPLYVAGNCAFYLFERGAGLENGANLLDDVVGVVLTVGFGAFAVVGALLVARRPTNLIGWIMAAIALMVSIFNAGGAYATYVMLTRGRPDALADVGAWAANCYWFVMLALALFYLPMLFPDGRKKRFFPAARRKVDPIIDYLSLAETTRARAGIEFDYQSMEL